jgi:hypothetical protein
LFVGDPDNSRKSEILTVLGGLLSHESNGWELQDSVQMIASPPGPVSTVGDVSIHYFYSPRLPCSEPP